MAMRTVRLEAEEEAVLAQVREATGWRISEVLKRGLGLLKEQLARESASLPYETYRQLDLGPGGYSLAPSNRVKSTVAAAVRRKLRR